MTDSLTDDIFNDATTEEVGDIFEGEEPEQPAPYKEDVKPPPNRYASRTSGESILSGIVIGFGSILVNRRIDPPVGRCLQLEAPLAGRHIDRVIANTWIDKLLQPLFRKSEDVEGLGAVLGLPILIAIIERKPELAPMLEGPLTEVLEMTLNELAPLMKAKKSKVRRAARSMADINDAFDIPRGTDPVDYIMSGFIFQDVGGAAHVAEE